MTDATQRALEAARQHPTAFSALVRADYRPASVHWKIGDALARVARGETNRLIISMPPQHGKSQLASIDFPAWYLGNYPERSILAASYSLDKVSEFGRKARDLIATPSYRAIFPNVRIAGSRPAQADWQLADHEGSYFGAGVEGPMTGRGGELVIIDDPIKNAEEAASASHRDAIYDWFMTVPRTRLRPPGAIIVIATRWHEDDLIGRLLKAQAEGGDQWEVLTLPAISDQGEALWPERYPLAELEQTRNALGSRAFEALYQQHPTSPGGAVFRADWMHRRWCNRHACPCDGVELPDGSVILSVDAAFKTGTGNDYSVIQAWQRGESAYYLVDQWRQRVEYPELRRAVELEAMKHRASAIYIEDAAAGQSVIQELRRNTRLPIIPVRPEGSKEARADAASPLFEAGKIILPSHAAWVNALIDELTTFPNGTHDDQVDAATQALRNMGKVSTTRTFDLEFRQLTTTPVPIPSGLGFTDKIRALSAERRRGRMAGPVGIGSVRIGR